VSDNRNYQERLQVIYKRVKHLPSLPPKIAHDMAEWDNPRSAAEEAEWDAALKTCVDAMREHKKKNDSQRNPAKSSFGPYVLGKQSYEDKVAL
jgi:hypothetical protein